MLETFYQGTLDLGNEIMFVLMPEKFCRKNVEMLFAQKLTLKLLIAFKMACSCF